jgi:hypothetical protein
LRRRDLGFPAPVRIRRRRYREIAALDDWDRANARKAAAPLKPPALPRLQRGRFTKPDDIEVR